METVFYKGGYELFLLVLLLKLKFREKFKKMETKVYIITKIEGEYAYLREEHLADGEELFIALYLLPQGADIGTRLLYNFPDFTIIE